MPSCSTARSSTATSATPRRTTSTRCSTDPFSGRPNENAGATPAFFVFVTASAGGAYWMPRAGHDVQGVIELRLRPAADIDHVAVAGGGVLVDEAGDQHTAVKGNDLAVLLAA